VAPERSEEQTARAVDAVTVAVAGADSAAFGRRFAAAVAGAFGFDAAGLAPVPGSGSVRLFTPAGEAVAPTGAGALFDRLSAAALSQGAVAVASGLSAAAPFVGLDAPARAVPGALVVPLATGAALGFACFSRAGHGRADAALVSLVHLFADRLREAARLESTAPHGDLSLTDDFGAYVEAFEHAPCALSLFDLASGRIAAVNAAFEAITGYRRDAVTGLGVVECGLMADPAEFEAFLARIQTESPVADFEAATRLADGRVVRGLVFASRVTMHGRPAVALVAPDAANRLAVRNELERSRAFFASTFYAPAAGNVLTRYDDGRIVDVNEALCETFGVTRDEVIGRTVVEAGFFTPERHLEVRQEMLARGPGAVIRDEMVTRSGERIVLERSSAVITIDGEQYLMTTCHDATRYERSAELLAQVERLGQIGGFQIDIETGRVEMTPETRRMVELAPDAALDLDAFRGHLASILTEHSAALWARSYALVLETGTPSDIELEAVLPSGRRAWLRILSRVREHRGHVYGMTGIMQDVTEVKHAERERRTYAAKLRQLAMERLQAERRERERIAALLHDTVIQDLAALKLAIGLRSREANDLEARTEALLERTNAIIGRSRDLLYELAPPLLHDLGLGPALEWVGERLTKETGIELDYRFEGQDRTLSREYRNLLYQSAQELLNNVVKHAKAGRAAIRTGMLADGGEYCLEVEDDGVGLGTDRPLSPEDEAGFGLFGVRNRLESTGGRLEFTTGAMGGVLARLIVPVKPVGIAGLDARRDTGHPREP